MNRFAQIVYLSTAFALSACQPALAVDANTCGYVQGNGGWYSQTDRSGPYTVDSNCNATLLSVADAVVKSTAGFRGGTIASGGAAQVFATTNIARRGFTIQNQSNGPLYIKIGGAAATPDYNSLRIDAGQLYETPSQHVSTGAISIYGATTGQAFYGTEF